MCKHLVTAVMILKVVLFHHLSLLFFKLFFLCKALHIFLTFLNSRHESVMTHKSYVGVLFIPDPDRQAARGVHPEGNVSLLFYVKIYAVVRIFVFLGFFNSWISFRVGDSLALMLTTTCQTPNTYHPNINLTLNFTTDPKSHLFPNWEHVGNWTGRPQLTSLKFVPNGSLWQRYTHTHTHTQYVRGRERKERAMEVEHSWTAAQNA